MTAEQHLIRSWHGLGMRTPDELDALVNARLLGGPTADGSEPNYEDFLVDTAD